jgi:hypothetical protein
VGFTIVVPGNNDNTHNTHNNNGDDGAVPLGRGLEPVPEDEEADAGEMEASRHHTGSGSGSGSGSVGGEEQGALLALRSPAVDPAATPDGGAEEIIETDSNGKNTKKTTKGKKGPSFSLFLTATAKAASSFLKPKPAASRPRRPSGTAMPPPLMERMVRERAPPSGMRDRGEDGSACCDR